MYQRVYTIVNNEYRHGYLLYLYFITIITMVYKSKITKVKLV